MDKLIWRVQRVGHLESTFKILGSGAPIVPQSQIVCSHLKYQTVNSRDFFFWFHNNHTFIAFQLSMQKKDGE